MKISYETVRAARPRTTSKLARVDGRAVALVTTFPKTRTEPASQHIYALDGRHPQTGEPCAGTMVGVTFGTDAAARLAVRALVERLARETMVQ